MKTRKNTWLIMWIAYFSGIGFCAAKDVSVTPLSEKVFQAIRVDSLSSTGSDVTCKLKEMNDFDNDADTRKFIACKASAGNVKVKAVPRPVIDKSLLPNAWTLTGGAGTDMLLRTIPLNVVGATDVIATCVNTKKTTTDIRPNYNLQFHDEPSRFKSHAPVTWDATLNVVSESAANSSNFTILESIT